MVGLSPLQPNRQNGLSWGFSGGFLFPKILSCKPAVNGKH
jgi:hypothetical protein